MKKLSIILTSFCAALSWHPSSEAAEVMKPFDFDDYDARMASMAEQDRLAQKQINELYAPLDDDLLDEDLRQAFALSMMPQPEVPVLGEDGSIPQEILAESIRTAQIEQERRVEQAQRELKAVHEEKAVVQNPPVLASQQPAEWEPLSGHLFRAGELIRELRQSNGIYPTHAEMAHHLVANMGDVTDVQVEKILSELGL